MDFLTFKDFISIPVLITFYYFGAVIFPSFVWILLVWFIKKYHFIGVVHDKGKTALWGILSNKQKIMLILSFLVAFLFMELFWRMLFEFLIAYMQIRDALLQ